MTVRGESYSLLGAGRHRVRFFEDGVELADRGSR